MNEKISLLLCLIFSIILSIELVSLKVAGLDLNERKGSDNRYIPPHLRSSDSSSFNKPQQSDYNQGEFRDNNYQQNRGGDRDFNNR